MYIRIYIVASHINGSSHIYSNNIEIENGMGYNGRELLSFMQVKANREIVFTTICNTHTIATLIYVTLNKYVGGLSFVDA